MTDTQVLAAKRKHEGYLRKIPGVRGVGANSKIIVYVKELTPQLAAWIPKELDGVPVQIVKGSFVITSLLEHIAVAQAIYADRTLRYRPVPGGVSIGHPEVTAGTVGCASRDKSTGEPLGLSNNHVGALQWGTQTIGKKGDPILQPGPADGGTLNDKIGELDRWVPVKLEPETNQVDAAAFSSGLLKKEVLDVGVPNTVVNPKAGMNVVKSGRTSGVTYGTIIDVNASISVEGWGVCEFVDVIVVQPAILSPGDSGSWVGELDTYRTVGLGFAGSPEISAICRGDVIEQLLNVEIIPPISGKSLIGLGLLSAGIFGAGALISRQPKEKGYTI